MAPATDPAVRREVTELFAGQGWPDGGDELLRRSLGPRPPELGPVWYRRALAFALWRPQILLGRLVPVLYALAKP
jgi:hypothetical protein